MVFGALPLELVQCVPACWPLLEAFYGQVEDRAELQGTLGGTHGTKALRSSWLQHVGRLQTAPRHLCDTCDRLGGQAGTDPGELSGARGAQARDPTQSLNEVDQRFCLLQRLRVLRWWFCARCPIFAQCSGCQYQREPWPCANMRLRHSGGFLSLSLSLFVALHGCGHLKILDVAELLVGLISRKH